MTGRTSLPLAALVLVLAGCQPEREPSAAATPQAEPYSNAVLVAPGATFSWPRVPLADLYRIELFDETHQLLGGAVTRDTTVPADAVVPDTASTGSWRVVPVTGGGTELPVSREGRFRR